MVHPDGADPGDTPADRIGGEPGASDASTGRKATPSRPEDTPPPRLAASIALVIAVILVAANMRPTISGVGPLLDQIGADTGMSVTVLGLIASVPLLAWAVVSPLALKLTRRFGMSQVVLASLVLLAIGTAVRSLPGPTVSLWLGTIFIGVALAIANVLMPAVIKRDFPGRLALMMALYTALLAGFGAVTSGVVVPLSHIGDESSGWRLALFITGIALLPFAIAAWGWATRHHHAAHRAHRASANAPRGRTGIWTDPVAWMVAGYMGFQSSIFYMTLTWLAAISTSTGRSEVVAGIDVMVYQLMAIVGSITTPLLLRGPLRRHIPALLPALGIVGVLGLIITPPAVLLWAILLGLSSGASLSMSLTLMAERARDHDASAALSGMSQSVGYSVAAVGPVVFGWLHSISGGWLFSLLLILVVMVAQAITGLFAARERFVLDR